MLSPHFPKRFALMFFRFSWCTLRCFSCPGTFGTWLCFALRASLCCVSGCARLSSWRFSSRACLRMGTSRWGGVCFSGRCLSWFSCFCGWVICCARCCCKLVERVSVFIRACQHFFTKQSNRNDDLRVVWNCCELKDSCLNCSLCRLIEELGRCGLQNCAFKKMHTC